MLTPMQVQYLVGLCCHRHDPNAVDVTVGDMVYDDAANEERDVDVTVTIRESDGTLSAFKATEVKREGRPLDVANVEQLCVKLKDMPSLTHRAIVSTSGFTDTAISKARAHGVVLYTLKPWTRPMSEQFPAFADFGASPERLMAEFQSTLLYWDNWTFQLVAPKGPSRFTLNDDASLLSGEGAHHNKYSVWKDFADALLLRSSDILFLLEPAVSVRRRFPLWARIEGADFSSTPAWPHTHTLDVREDQVFLEFESGLVLLETVTISGHLQWRRRSRTPEFFIIESVPDGQAFAAAVIASYGTDDGRMFVMTIPPSTREVGLHELQLLEKHKNAIRRLKIPVT
jgi:hypothetical protein